MSIELAVTINAETELALLVFDGAETAWIPKSQIKNYDEEEMVVGRTTEIEIPEWLALRKGFV